MQRRQYLHFADTDVFGGGVDLDQNATGSWRLEELAEISASGRGVEAFGVPLAAGGFVGVQVDPGNGDLGQFVDLGSDGLLGSDG